jgi:hypothetical protein
VDAPRANIDLDEGNHQGVNIDDNKHYGNIDPQQEYPILENIAFSSRLLPLPGEGGRGMNGRRGEGGDRMDIEGDPLTGSHRKGGKFGTPSKTINRGESEGAGFDLNLSASDLEFTRAGDHHRLSNFSISQLSHEDGKGGSILSQGNSSANKKLLMNSLNNKFEDTTLPTFEDGMNMNMFDDLKFDISQTNMMIPPIPVPPSSTQKHGKKSAFCPRCF